MLIVFPLKVLFLKFPLSVSLSIVDVLWVIFFVIRYRVVGECVCVSVCVCVCVCVCVRGWSERE